MAEDIDSVEEQEVSKRGPASLVNVHVDESLGVIFLGVMALALLILFMRSQDRLREALESRIFRTPLE